LLIKSPSDCGGSIGLINPSRGIGAEFLLRGRILDSVVVAGGVSGGVSSSAGFISPVQPTSVWFHGVLSEERYVKESKRAEVPRREFNP
jgi:hypothetical protein